MAAAQSGIGSGQPPIPTPIPIPFPMAKTVDPNDDKVIETAQFAVVTYNKQAGTDLVFINVKFGFQWSICGGTQYILAIKTQDDEGTYCDVALVCDKLVSNAYKYELIWYNEKNK